MMTKKFEVVFLEGARQYLKSLDKPTRKKISTVIDKSMYFNDSTLFKKLNDEIWEFRIMFRGQKYRLLSFWDKRDKKNTLVVATHGFVKKTWEVPQKEISKAEQIKKQYFSN